MTARDYIRAARLLRDWAACLRKSNSAKGRWSSPDDLAEYEEHVALARKLAAMGRAA